jgi:hypothetical protein
MLATFYFKIAPMIPIPWKEPPASLMEHTYQLANYFWLEATHTIRLV